MNKTLYILERLDIRPSTLASFIGVKTETICGWMNFEYESHFAFNRIEKLYHVVAAFYVCEIDRDMMINLLNEPMLGEDSESWLDLIMKK